MRYQTEILKMLRRRQPIETAEMERKGTLDDFLDGMAEKMRAYETEMIRQALDRTRESRTLEGHEAPMQAQQQASADNLASLDWMIDWEPEARKQAHEEGFEEFPSQESEEDQILEPYIQEYLPVCGGDRKEARARAREYAETTGQLAQLHI